MRNHLCQVGTIIFLVFGPIFLPGQTTDNSRDKFVMSYDPSSAPTHVLPAGNLGADDLIELMIPYCPELSRSFRVGSDGYLTLPLLKKKLYVIGLTPIQVEMKLAEELKSEEVLADPIVNVSVLEYRSRPVSVVGAVNHPLTFQATGTTTLLEAIAKAGGLSPNAGAEIIVTRDVQNSQATNRVQTIFVKDLIEASDPRYNLKMYGGEEIRIPELNKIFVTGNVRRPGMYSMQTNSDTTVLKALALSEGLEAFTAKRAYVYRLRPSGGEREELEIPLKSIMERKASDVKLQADDVLYVPANNGRRLTSKILGQITSFGQTTASGVVIYH
jgi:polysaccharide biosynthesis/export protein